MENKASLVSEIIDEIFRFATEMAETIECGDAVKSGKKSDIPLIDVELDLIPQMDSLENDCHTIDQGVMAHKSTRMYSSSDVETQRKPENLTHTKEMHSLNSKGYTTAILESNRIVYNLSLTRDACNVELHHVKCEGYPIKMTESELILLFEECGQVYSLRISEHKFIIVTYTKAEDAEKAEHLLHRRNIEGHKIKVHRCLDTTRIIVRGIPTSITKNQLFLRFSGLTTGLRSVEVLNDPVNENRIRNFCYLDYGSYLNAAKAKKFLSSHFSSHATCTVEWPNKHFEWTNTPDTLYINNLRSNMRTSDLREMFSVYGEVTFVDTYGNFAKVKFRNVKDADRAAHQIDKSLLGNENVDIRSVKLSSYQTHTEKASCDRNMNPISFETRGRNPCPMSADTRDRNSHEKSVDARDLKPLQSASDTLYLRNLRSTIAAIDLRKCFSVYGEVMSVDKNKNSASVHFRKLENAKRAAQDVDKRQLGVNVNISFFEQPETSDKLYIYNMHADMTTKRLRAIFSVHGEVTDIDLEDGFAIVGFRSNEHSVRAMQCINRMHLGKGNVEVYFFPK